MSPPTMRQHPTEPLAEAAVPKVQRQAARLSSPTGRAPDRATTKIVGEPALRRGSTFRRDPRAGAPFYYLSLQRQPLIRLLRLDKKTVTENRPQGFSITTVSLAAAPPFYALSYCWGSSERDTYIVCNGKLLGVTLQLSQGIKELQNIPALVDSWVWIDQISVNQDDPDERSHQVGLMRDIYIKAVRTVVWLGPSDGPCEGGYGLSKRLADICRNDKYSTSTMGWKMRHPKRPLKEEFDDDFRQAVPRINSRPWEELNRMLSKPWFSRIWIIQEVDLSRQPPLLVYGGKARDFIPPLLAGRWIGGPRAQSTLHSSQPPPLSNYCLGDLFMILSSRNRWSLEALLLHTLHHEATDPRDHIFALLGIATETSGMSRWPPELLPDYRESSQRVFRRATTYLIMQSGRLTPLLLAGMGEHIESESSEEVLPSWVPDYGAKPTLPCAMDVRLSSRTRAVEVVIPWRASSHLVARPQVTENVISLEGCEVDQIVWTSATITERRDASQLYHWLNDAAGAISSSLEKFDASVTLEYDTISRDFLDSFTSTISAVYNDGSRKPHIRDILEYMDLQDSIAQPERASIPSYFETMRARFLNSITTSPDPSKPCPVSDLIEFFSTHVWNIFLTKTGHFGIGRSSFAEGDIVTVLWGGAMPFVLRSSDTNYKLLGACVILKWMNGLAVEKYKSGSLGLTTYSII